LLTAIFKYPFLLKIFFYIFVNCYIQIPVSSENIFYILVCTTCSLIRVEVTTDRKEAHFSIWGSCRYPKLIYTISVLDNRVLAL